MNDPQKNIPVKVKKKPNWVGRAFLAIAFIFGITLLASCNQAFMSESDKANVIYSSLYGQDSALANRSGDSKNVNKGLLERDSAVTQDPNAKTKNGVYDVLGASYALPSQEWENYISVAYTYNIKAEAVSGKENTFKVTGSVTPVNEKSIAVQWIDNNFFKQTDTTLLKKEFGEAVVKIKDPYEITIDPQDVTEGLTAQDLAVDSYWDAFQSVKAQALYGGLDADGNSINWKNYNEYFLKAQSDTTFADTEAERYKLIPTLSFVTAFQTQMNTVAGNNRSGLNTSGVGGMFGQAGKKTYMEAKSWGEAFSKYGFFNGLFVWPFGWLINTFTRAFKATGMWAGFLAIMLFTVIIRAVFIVLSIFTNKSQLKMTELQPEVNAIQARYPNAQNSRDERSAMTQEINALYRKNKVNRFMPILTMIIQFPIFLCVWSALQGAAELYSVNFFGLEFTTSMSSYITGNFVNSSSFSVLGIRTLAVFIFIWMSVAQVLCMGLPQWFNSWKIRRFSPAKTMPDAPQGTASKIGKYMVWGMSIFIIITGFSLPAGMSIYWFFGAIMALVQTFVTELMYMARRHKKNKDGDVLSSMRRSKHHSDSIRSIKRAK